MRRRRFLAAERSKLEPGRSKKELATRMKINEILRHPFVLFFLGFLLSGVIGGTVSRYYERRDYQKSIELKRLDYAIQIIRPAAESLARASALVEGIKADESEASLNSIYVAYKTSQDVWKTQLNQSIAMGYSLVRYESDLDKEYGDFMLKSKSIKWILHDVDISLQPMDECLREVMRRDINDRKNYIGECWVRQKMNGTYLDSKQLERRILQSEECLEYTQLRLSDISFGGNPLDFGANISCTMAIDPNPGLPGPKIEEPIDLYEEWTKLKEKIFSPETYLPD